MYGELKSDGRETLLQTRLRKYTYLLIMVSVAGKVSAAWKIVINWYIVAA
jgi:hypothetical protein